MGNVKVRKQRHLRTGANPNPFPTVEQIVTGVVTGIASELVAKAANKLANIAKNHRAGARVPEGVRPQRTQTPQPAVSADEAAASHSERKAARAKRAAKRTPKK